MSFGGPFDAFKPMMDFQFGSSPMHHDSRMERVAIGNKEDRLVETLRIVEAYLYATAPGSNELEIVSSALKGHKQAGSASERLR